MADSTRPTGSETAEPVGLTQSHQGEDPRPATAISAPRLGADLTCRVCGRDFAASKAANRAYALRAHERKEHGLRAREGATAPASVLQLQRPPGPKRSETDLPAAGGLLASMADAEERTRAEDAERRRRVSLRRAEWSKALRADVNPALVRFGASFIGAQELWLDLKPPPEMPRGGVGLAQVSGPDGKPTLVPIWNPPLRERLELSSSQADRLARAAAEFAETPTGLALLGWVDSHAGLIALGLAGYVAASYGFGLARMRVEVGQINKQLAVIAEQGIPTPGSEDGAEAVEPVAGEAA